jgi:hypothetical protein
MGEKSWAEAVAGGAVGEVLVAGSLERGGFTKIGHDDAGEGGKRVTSEESF